MLKIVEIEGFWPQRVEIILTWPNPQTLNKYLLVKIVKFWPCTLNWKEGGNVEIEGLQTVPAAAVGLLAVLAEAIGSECLSITYNINPKYTSHKLMKLKVCPSRALGSLYRGGIHYPFNNEVCIRPTVHRTNTCDVRVSPKYRRTDATLGGCIVHNTPSWCRLTNEVTNRQLCCGIEHLHTRRE